MRVAAVRQLVPAAPALNEDSVADETHQAAAQRSVVRVVHHGSQVVARRAAESVGVGLREVGGEVLKGSGHDLRGSLVSRPKGADAGGRVGQRAVEQAGGQGGEMAACLRLW